MKEYELDAPKSQMGRGCGQSFFVFENVVRPYRISLMPSLLLISVSGHRGEQRQYPSAGHPVPANFSNFTGYTLLLVSSAVQAMYQFKVMEQTWAFQCVTYSTFRPTAHSATATVVFGRKVSQEYEDYCMLSDLGERNLLNNDPAIQCMLRDTTLLRFV